MTLATPPIYNAKAFSKDTAEQIAEDYLSATVGLHYKATNGISVNDCWYFLIRYEDKGQCEAVTVGKIVVNHYGVVPLTEDQLREIQERTIMQAAQHGHLLPQSSHGYVLYTYARDQATQWLSDYLGMHFFATKGEFVKVASPHWRFAIHFRLPHMGEIATMGVIQVDGTTGQVRPLSTSHRQAIQEHTRGVVRNRTLASAA